MSPDRVSEQTVFGLPKEIDGEKESQDPFEELAVEEPSGGTPAASAPSETPEGDPGDGASAALPTEGATSEAPAEGTTEEPEPALDETEATPYTGRYASKYETIQALEDAHRAQIASAQSTAERVRQLEQDNLQLVQYLQVAAQKFQEAPKPAEVPIETQAEQMGVDPEVLKAAQIIAQQQMAPLQAQIQAQQAQSTQQAQVWQQEQAAAQVRSLAAQFRVEHPDVDPETEGEMVSVFNSLGLDPTVSDNYAIAFEAAQNPDLRMVLNVNPNYVETDEGMNYARRIAKQSVPPVANSPSQREDELAAARKKAQVESGSSGAPIGASEEKPKDMWDEVLALPKPSSAFGV